MPEVTFTRNNDYQATHLSRAQANELLHAADVAELAAKTTPGE